MKKFNITGTCIKENHYMVDTCDKLNKIMKLIKNRKYFTINRPRQYGNEMNIIETKRWNGEVSHKKGLKQLWDYLDINGLDYGYLLVFDFRKKENRDRDIDEIDVDGKRIFCVWV